MADPTPPTRWLKWWVCVLLLLASTLNYMDRQALSLTGEEIKPYFNLSYSQYSRLEGAFNACFALGAILVGWCVDRGNVRWIYPIIVSLWSLAGFLTGFAESYLVLLICRCLLGLFEAGNIPCGVLTVKRVLRPEERSLGNALFQSGSAIGAIVTPWVVLACLAVVAGMAAAEPGLTWKLPFRVVGAAGLLWAGAWLLSVRSHHVRTTPPSATAERDTDTYWAIFRNRRFWVALVVVMAINTPWRAFVFWLPLMLREKGFEREDVLSYITPGFFLAADLGSMAVGAAILALARRGWTLPNARLLCFAFCTALTMLSLLTAIFPRGPMLVALLMLLGFGALGLFPIYYALSQDISARHQGKVTGTLSFTNAIYLALLIPLQGEMVDQLGSFSLALGVVGVAPLAGLIALACFWRRGT